MSTGLEFETGERTSFTDNVCSVCVAAMEIADDLLERCSMCGQTAAEAAVTNGDNIKDRPEVLRGDPASFGWFEHSSDPSHAQEDIIDLDKVMAEAKARRAAAPTAPTTPAAAAATGEPGAGEIGPETKPQEAAAGKPGFRNQNGKGKKRPGE